MFYCSSIFHSLCGNGHTVHFCSFFVPFSLDRECINNLAADLVWCLCHVWFFFALLRNYYVLHAILLFFLFAWMLVTLVRNQFICPQKFCNEETKTAKADFDTHTQRIWLLFLFHFFVFLIRSNKNPNWNSERPNNINFNTFNLYSFLFVVAGADF